MFDFRYHALSLAAVLLALAVGLLLGVAIGDSNLVSSAKNGIVAQLRRDVGSAQQQASQLQGQLTARSTFESDLFPIAVAGRLSGRSIGLIFLGSASNQIDGLVRDTLPTAGGRLASVAAVREPLDLPGMASTFLTRLRVGGKLVDAKGVSRLYRSRISNLTLIFMLLVGLSALFAALWSTTGGRALLQVLAARWDDLWSFVVGTVT